MTKSRTKEQKNAKPYGCVVPRCGFYSATVEEDLEHYRKKHPNVQLILRPDGTFTVDMRTAKQAAVSKKPKRKKRKKTKPSESAELINWSKTDFDTKKKIQEFLRAELKSALEKNPEADLKQVIGYAYGPNKFGIGLCHKVAVCFGVNIFEETVTRLTAE